MSWQFESGPDTGTESKQVRTRIGGSPIQNEPETKTDIAPETNTELGASADPPISFASTCTGPKHPIAVERNPFGDTGPSELCVPKVPKAMSGKRTGAGPSPHRFALTSIGIQSDVALMTRTFGDSVASAASSAKARACVKI